MRLPGLEPGTKAWKASMLTPTPQTLLEKYLNYYDSNTTYHHNVATPSLGVEPRPPA